MQFGSLNHNLDAHGDFNASGVIAFDSVTVEKARRPIGFRFLPHIINIKARYEGREVIVTGEADSEDLAYAKARSELIERSALFAFPSFGDAATSNGWAAHPVAAHAKQNAIFELIERDAVLSQWYSATPFLELPFMEFPAKLQEWVATELSKSEYPELVVLVSTRGIGPSVTVLLKNHEGFGVSGHATRADLAESIEAALAEACRAAHATLRREYWGDTLKLKNKTPGKVQPGAHGVFYAYHEAFPGWMRGAHQSWREATASWSARIAQVPQSGFEFHAVLESPCVVGYARHPEAFEVRWGAAVKEDVAGSRGAKRMGLDLINLQTHIVS